MNVLYYSILANFLISLASLAGVFTLSIKEQKLQRWLLLLVGLSAGAMMGGAFFHLIPEAAETLSLSTVFLIVFLAFCLFFLIEKLLLWHHCHYSRKQKHAFGYMNLFGDGMHNFIDGMIITAALMSDFRLGIASVVAIALHEIPQEVSDFGVLLYSGMSKFRALFYNLLAGMAAIAGGIISYYLAGQISQLIPSLLAFAAGGFIYIAASDLLPELRKETGLKKSLKSFILFLAGAFMMYLLK